MAEDSMRGMVQTVLGPVAPEALGPTMTHEHLIIDFTCMFAPPEGAGQRARAFEPITMENLGWINYDWTRHYENLLLTDVEMAVEETQRYRDLGGGTLVDATTMGIGRDPVSLAQISRRTGLNVVMGAGYYVERVHPDDVGTLGVSEVAQRIVDEVLVGVGSTGVRAGIIGEIGCTWPLGDGERKVLAAAAAAQRETGAAVLIHPGRDAAAPLEILEVLAEAGADLGRVIMGHLDRTITEVSTLLT